MDQGCEFLAGGGPDQIKLPVDAPQARTRAIDGPRPLADQPAHEVEQEALDGQADLVAGEGDAETAQVPLDADLIGSDDEIVQRVLGAGEPLMLSIIQSTRSVSPSASHARPCAPMIRSAMRAETAWCFRPRLSCQCRK